MSKKNAQSLSNNQIILDEIINQEFVENGNYERINDFFELFAANQILKQYDLSYDELEAGITGSGLDGGCDGIYLFLNGTLVTEDFNYEQLKKDIKLEFFILQSKNTTTFNESVFEKWKTTSENLLSMSNDQSTFKSRYNTDILAGFQLFRETYIKLIRRQIKVDINFIYISKGIEIHPNVESQAEELRTLVKKLFPNKNLKVNTIFIGSDDLMELLNQQENDTFSLKLLENPITYANKNDYITLVKLTDYFNFITNEHNELIRHIFESNVRDYQGHTTVNNEIQKTLTEDTSGEFWWFNNGVTVVAKEASLVTGRELSINCPEIVNGLQTSSEIFNYFSQFPEKLTEDTRSLLVRVIVPEDDEERDKIILATNSQTSIPKASLRATDSIHRQIEMYFKSKGLFYDRRKNYYKNLGKKPSAIVSISFLGQILMSVVLKKPDFARARPSTILTNDDEYRKLFTDNFSLDSYYNLAVAGKHFESTIKKIDKLNTIERGDILFYVIYYSISLYFKTLNITNKHLANLDISGFDDEFIFECTDTIYDEYMKLGGTSRVAKGSELISKVNVILASMIEC